MASAHLSRFACDLVAHYTFASRPNQLSASFVEQPEIEQYLQQSRTAFGLDQYVKLNTKITHAEFSDNRTLAINQRGGETFSFDVVINAWVMEIYGGLPDVEALILVVTVGTVHVGIMA